MLTMNCNFCKIKISPLNSAKLNVVLTVEESGGDEKDTPVHAHYRFCSPECVSSRLSSLNQHGVPFQPTVEIVNMKVSSVHPYVATVYLRAHPVKMEILA